MSYILFENNTIYVKKIICVGANYAEHNAEMGRASKPESFLFLKPATALVPEQSPILIPPFTTNLHHEVEMVILIGTGGRRIPLEKAFDHIAGVGAGIDLTARDLQSRAKEHGLPWSMSKAFDGSARVSHFVPMNSCEDIDNLDLTLAVNGEVRQQGNTSNMLLSCASLVQFASRFFTLQEGDLLFTGTPAGVGPLKKGDKVEIGLNGLVGAEYDVDEEQDLDKC